MAWVNVSDDELLLLWRALRLFRSDRQPACAPDGRPPASACPLFAQCPRWHSQTDEIGSLSETEQRQATWPCSRLLDLLASDQDWPG